MAYSGQVTVIPLGKGGLLTDVPQTEVPPNRLTRAENINFYRGLLEKDFGSRRWNGVQVPLTTNPMGSATGIKQIYDYWPSDLNQRVIVVTKDGAVYRFHDPWNLSQVTPVIGNSVTYLFTQNYVSMVTGGGEQSGNPRKLFILNGHDTPQVISGDSTTRGVMNHPAADWTGSNQPFGAVVYQGSFWCYGNANNPHTVYRSLATDHTDFTTSPYTMTFFPGEGEKIVAHFVWLGRLWFLKYPNGLYYINTNGTTDQTQWAPAKSFDTFGGVAPNACVNVFDDTLVCNSYGSLTSIKSTNFFGDVLNSDVFAQIGTLEYIRNEIRTDDFFERQLVYYQDKKELYVKSTSAGGIVPDRLICVSYRISQSPEVRIMTKDQPSCITMIKDQRFVQRPVIGSDDGYLYSLDQPDRQIEDFNANTIGGYQFFAETGDIDLGTQTPAIADLNKKFDFLEIIYEPTGRYTLYIDIFIDGKFSETVPFVLEGDAILGQFRIGSATKDTSSNVGLMSSRTPRSLRRQIHGMGRRIKFKIYDSGVPLQNFRLIDLRLYYKVSSEQEKE